VKTLALLSLALARVRNSARRWRPQPVQHVPVERPPRSRRPAGRTLILWNANQIHPYALTIDEPDREFYWTN
jgi:hypothetical protein